MKLSPLFTALALTAASHTALAADGTADLYDAVAPADSAFVRVLNRSASSIDVALSVKLNAQKVAPGQLIGYRFVP
ncbi:alginate O-acetyltransferase AlgF, partial [Pseudomonas sp. BJa3]|uniref:alginate O-acetyltransferase AlgF n=1 Tax=Pseudomonas sp. BJa3 TaxID=2986525 RepID=UPI002265A0CC